MNTKLLTIFILLNVANVIIQTIKSIATVKCGKVGASLTNAVAYGLYTIVTIYLMCDLPLMWKAVIVALCNLVGVFVVKWAEERLRKDKLWKIEATVRNAYTEALHETLTARGISHNYIPDLGKYTVFNLYCETQTESKFAKEILDRHKAKYFVSESKTL